jgi:hypothetical protein
MAFEKNSRRGFSVKSRKIYRRYNETPTKGTAVNKEKITKIKSKLKKNAPEIVVFTVALSGLAYAARGVLKQVNAASEFFEPLQPVDRDTQKTLMEDEAFSLYKLTDDEYMFARDVAQS